MNFVLKPDLAHGLPSVKEPHPLSRCAKKLGRAGYTVGALPTPDLKKPCGEGVKRGGAAINENCRRVKLPDALGKERKMRTAEDDGVGGEVAQGRKLCLYFSHKAPIGSASRSTLR